MTPTTGRPGRPTERRRLVRSLAMAVALLLGTVAHARAQAPAASDAKPSLEIYGFAMLDMGINLKTINPNWTDTMRVTRLPSFDKQFGEDGSTFAGVRQSSLGVRSSTPTSLGDLRTTFEFEVFGTGVDEGQTTLRLRHASGELGKFGAGQTWSPFMDIDVFPNSLEYWVQRAWFSFATSRCAGCLSRATAALRWRSNVQVHRVGPTFSTRPYPA